MVMIRGTIKVAILAAFFVEGYGCASVEEGYLLLLIEFQFNDRLINGRQQEQEHQKEKRLCFSENLLTR